MSVKRFSPVSRQYARFLLTGAAFTLAGPSLFYLMALGMAPLLSSFLTEISMHSARCIVYNRFVFSSEGTGIRTYLTAAVPISLINLGLVFVLQQHFPLWHIACIIGFQGATIGYLWSRFCYRYNLSSRLRSRAR